MKNLILGFISIIFFLNFNAQEASTNEKLKEVFSQEKIQKINANTQKKTYYDFLLNKSYRLITYNVDEVAKSNFIQSYTFTYTNKDKTTVTQDAKDVLKEIENGTFNILKYNIDRLINDNLFIRLGNSNKVLVIYSFDYIQKNFKA